MLKGIRKQFNDRVFAKVEKEVTLVKEQQEQLENVNFLKTVRKAKTVRIVIGSILFFLALLLRLPIKFEITLFAISYILIGVEVVLSAFKNIFKGRVFDENFLMTIATIGAFAIKEFPEAVAVMLFYQVGEYFEEIAVDRSRKSITELMDIRPDYATLVVENRERRVHPGEVNVDDIIVVKPGEKVPLDGKVIDGNAALNVSALTGESLPKQVGAESEILSGCICIDGVLTIKVTKEFSESTASKILDLVGNASSKKAPTENFITKFARYYTPAVVLIAFFLAVIPPLFINTASFVEWLYRALVFLVISCPCALVVSIPLGFFGGIAAASKNGILVKGGNYLEALNDVDTIVFDKTGTLTEGVFSVTAIMPNGDFVSEAELLEYAAYAEYYSNHPIAVSIKSEYGKKVNADYILDYSEIPGYGTKVKAKGKNIIVGNSKLMIRENILFEEAEAMGTVIYVAVDENYAGHVVISDKIKEDSVKAIKDLKQVGVNRIVMLTGDSSNIAQRIGHELGIDELYSELLPEQKVEKLEILFRSRLNRGKIIFVGDGINDAPVLARADVGIAMGGIGSDAAIEAADVVLMTDQPSKIADAIKIARRTRRIVWQNIIFALSVKIFVLALGAGGIASMWEAVFADVGVALLAIVNSMRAMRS